MFSAFTSADLNIFKNLYLLTVIPFFLFLFELFIRVPLTLGKHNKRYIFVMATIKIKVSDSVQV